MAKRISMATKPGAPTPDQWVSGVTAPNDSAADDSSGNGASAAAQSSVLENQSTENPVKTGETAPTKRLTLDIPEALHARIKSQCALRGTKMVDEIRALLETHFSA